MAILIMTEVLKISLYLCLIIWLLTSLLMEIKCCQAPNNVHYFGIHLWNQYSFQGWDQHTLSHFEIISNWRLTENICHGWSQNVAHSYESQVAIH